MAEELTGQVADQLEEAAEVTRRLSGRDFRFLFGGICLGAAAGFGLGYLTQKVKMETKYSKISETEIDEMREHYLKKTMVAEPKPDVEEVVEKLNYSPKVVTDRPRPTRPPVIAEEPSSRPPTPMQAETIVEGWDYQTELRARVEGVPHIIHIDEFENNETENDQTQFSYYEGDGVLTDPRDQPIENVEQLLGDLDKNLRFGHGSPDPRIVYIRNERLSLDIEVSLNPGSFEEEVHGVVRHSSESRKPQRLRFDDD